MTHRGQRSRQAQTRRLYRQQQRTANRIIWQNAKHDTKKGETIHILQKDTIIETLTFMYGPIHMGAIPELEIGLILSDSRGDGYYQLLIQ